MKEYKKITKYGDYYKIYYNKSKYEDDIQSMYMYYEDVKVFESNEEKELREKSEKRNNRIDKILDN